MNDVDIELMRQAILWSKGCQPVEERIPKVGAIIAVEEKVIGRGRRGTGIPEDDNHAEHDALENIKDEDRSLLPKAAVYTTLELLSESDQLEFGTHKADSSQSEGTGSGRERNSEGPAE